MLYFTKPFKLYNNKQTATYNDPTTTAIIAMFKLCSVISLVKQDYRMTGQDINKLKGNIRTTYNKVTPRMLLRAKMHEN